MKLIPITRALLIFLDELEYTEAALLADPETEDLAAPFTEAIKEWDGIFRKERAARRDVTRSEAVVEVRNNHIDRLTLRFGGVVLVEANQDRKSALFRRFFTVAPSEFVRMALRRQAEQTIQAVLPEILKFDKKSPLHPFAALLEKAARAALEALDTRGRAKAARGSTGNDVDEWKEGINRLRLGTYAALLKLASEKGYGRPWAESYFRVDGSRAEDEEAPAPPAPVLPPA